MKNELRAPRNTTKDIAKNPYGFIADAMGVGTSGAIELQKASGQRQLVGSDVLPTKMQKEDRVALEKAGFKFLGEVPDDPIFQYVEMPAGWKKASTDHSMWSHLVDDKGRIRGSIFYKAAFYDRDAHMGMNTRYHAGKDYSRNDYATVNVGVVRDRGDGDKIIFSTEPVPSPKERSWEASDKVSAEAVAWMKEKFPNSSDFTAYWD